METIIPEEWFRGPTFEQFVDGLYRKGPGKYWRRRRKPRWVRQLVSSDAGNAMLHIMHDNCVQAWRWAEGCHKNTMLLFSPPDGNGEN